MSCFCLEAVMAVLIDFDAQILLKEEDAEYFIT